MPIREIDIRFEYPKNEADMRRLIKEHRYVRRKWLSTAIIDGKMRMRFGRFEIYTETTPETIVARKPNKPRSDIGKPRKKVLTPVVSYPGQTGSGRPEWDR